MNVVGAFRMIRAVEPALRKQGRGSIVNISSRAGIDSTGTSIAYAALAAGSDWPAPRLAKGGAADFLILEPLDSVEPCRDSTCFK